MNLRIFMSSLLAITLFVGCANKADIVNQPNSSNGAPEGSMAATDSKPPVSIQISAASINVVPGTTQTLFATAVYPDNSHKNVTKGITYSSSDSNVVSISSKGVAKSKNPGDATLTVKLASGESHSVKVHVSDAKLVSIQVTPAIPSLSLGMTQQFTATGIFSDNTHQDITNQVTWKSSDKKVATITPGGAEQEDDDDEVIISGGLATVTGIGKTTVTASYGHQENSNNNSEKSGKNGDKGKKSDDHGKKISLISASTVLTVKSITLTSLSITPSTISIPAGLSQQLSVSGIYSDGSKKDLSAVVNWSSSDTAIASVSNIAPKGLVYAATTGAATITVTEPGTGLTATASISATPAQLVSINVTPGVVSAARGLNQQFIANGTYTDKSVKDISAAVTWSSSNVLSSSISNAAGTNGLAAAVDVGLSTISATDPASGIAATASFTVTPALLVSLTVNPLSANIALGLSTNYTASGKYTDQSVKDLTTVVTWNTLDITVAQVSNASGSNGLVTPIAIGTTSVTAIEPATGISASATVVAIPAQLVSINVTPAATSIAKGLSQQFTASGTYTDNSVKDFTATVTWTSSNVAAVSISNTAGSNGLASALAVGVSTITATELATGITGTASITINPPALVSLSINPATAIIVMGQSANFTATGTYTDNSVQDLTALVTWNTDNITIAQASNNAGSNGLVTPVSVGTAILSAIDPASGIATTAALTIKPAPVLVSIAVTPQNAAIPSGGSLQYTAMGTYDNGNVVDVTQSVTWSTNNPKIVTISNVPGSIGLLTDYGIALQKGGLVISVVALDAITGISGIASATTGTISNGTLTIEPANASLFLGQGFQYMATYTDINGNVTDVTNSVIWSSSDSRIAAIGSSLSMMGFVKTYATGTVTINAFAEKLRLSSSTILTVIPGLPSALLTSLNMTGGAISATNARFIATGNYADGTVADLTNISQWVWDPNVVTMLRPGMFIPRGVGATKIYATTGLISNAMTITVTSDTLGNLFMSVSLAVSKRRGKNAN